MESFEKPSNDLTTLTHLPMAVEPTFVRPIKVRCPECFKLYSVNPGEIHEARPKFKCTSCETRFWLAYPEALEQDEIIGFPTEWIEGAQDKVEAPVEEKLPDATNHEELQAKETSQLEFSLERTEFHCPKCSSPYKVGAEECSSCGVVFRKFEALQDGPMVPASDELKLSWENVVEKYEDREQHEEFVRACRTEDNLSYAGQKYRRILEANPSDELANDFRKMVVALAEVDATPVAVASKKVSKKRFSFTSLMMVLAGMLMAAGYFMPIFRNLVGIGAALLFLALAIKFYFR